MFLASALSMNMFQMRVVKYWNNIFDMFKMAVSVCDCKVKPKNDKKDKPWNY